MPEDIFLIFLDLNLRISKAVVQHSTEKYFVL